ncbi:F-box domain-containing protein [Bimuria novae-zelandiae CBS 107.79]|uniref:F-box domain-containing protein n=1 Tax=Bimuria novae-zelandiae CBS 107.79 TaxID=1447943 RepID=A0A6A5VHW3_9PLEO|nr:F-box domain-containing protein [Bimuria novae-zelandiae CBS 107.79]
MAECYLYKLPNELLIYLLTPMTTPELLPLASVSHRIYTIVLRILHNRLVIASELDSHSVLLECFHPSAKLTEPPYFCTYHGTDGLQLYDGYAEDEKNLAKRLGEMRNIYSRFRPHRRELETGGRKVRRPPGDVPGSRTFAGTAGDGFEGDTVKQILSLDANELFTQLVAQTNLVKIGPRNGLFTCFVPIEEGVIRVWRDWLRNMPDMGNTTEPKTEEPVVEVGNGEEKAVTVEFSDASKDLEDERILWVSPSKDTGIRFRVRERKIKRDNPILVRVDEEDLPVSYEIEYDELLIRTSHLLLMLEKSLVQVDNSSGKAVVFGSFG